MCPYAAPPTAEPPAYPVTADNIPFLIEAGELESMHAVTISSPANWHLNYQIVYLPVEGEFVHAGDTVVIFDTREVENRYAESRKQLEKLQLQLEATQLSNRQTIAAIEASLRTFEIQEQISQNQVAQAAFNSASEQKDAALELEKTRHYLSRERAALTAQYTLNRNAEQQIELQINQVRGQMEQNRRIISDMYLITPKDGMVVYYRGRRGQSDVIKTGDTVSPQTAILMIPDLNHMRAFVSINEVDYSLVREGLPAEILIEAYPDTLFSGHVSFISRIVDTNTSLSDLKNYYLQVDLHSRANYRLKPGLSARVTILCDRLPSRLRVPSFCLYHRENQFGLTDTGGRFIPIALQGLSSGFAFFDAPLEPGEKVRPNTAPPYF